MFFGDVQKSSLSYVNDLISIRGKFSDQQLEEVKFIESQLISTIEKHSPTYFDEFYSQISSKNHLQIEEALENGTSKMKEAILNSPELAEYFLLGEKLAAEIDIAKFTNSKGTVNIEALTAFAKEELSTMQEELICGPTFCVAAVYIAVAISVAAVVNYAGGVNVSLWFNVATEVNAVNGVQGGGSLKSELTKDIFIDEIAINF